MNLKRYFLIAGIVMIVFSLATLLIEVSIPGQVRQETALVNYSQSGKYSYNIYLKPSYLYGPAPQSSSAGFQYPLTAVETIDFTYSFNSLTEGSGSAYIEAVLENPGIWQKRVILLSETATAGDFNLSFSLDPNRMSSLFEAIEKETGLSGSARKLNVDVHINSGGQSFVQSLPVTLDKNLIEISGDLTQSLPQGTGKFDYSLNRKTTSGGTESSVGKYPVRIVSSLDFSFSYLPASTNLAVVSVEAVLENPGLWQKKINLIPATNFSANFGGKFRLNLDDIQNQFDQIDTQTDLTTSLRLITIRALIVQGNDTFGQSLLITINGGILEIPVDLQLAQSNGTGIFDYTVNLKPNSLFDSATLHPSQASSTPVSSYDINLKPSTADFAQTRLNSDQTAFTRLIDRMDVTFYYQFQSDQPVSGLKTDADIIATIEAPKVWSKTFKLMQTSKSGNFNLSLPVDIAGYVALLQAINTETGVSPDSYNISIIANLHTTGETSSGKIDETFSPALRGTISGGVLQWNKELTTNLPGSIKTTETISNPQKYAGLSTAGFKNIILVLIVLFFLLSVGLFILYFRTKSVKLSPFEKEELRINKKYGVRLVKALNHGPAEVETIIPVNSIEELIKVADELAKPIIYQAPGPQGLLNSYFVLDGTTRYQYLLVRDSRLEIRKDKTE